MNMPYLDLLPSFPKKVWLILKCRSDENKGGANGCKKHQQSK
jgi:hypothetical protein